MELKPEIKEMLSGFEKRMKFINIARYMTDYIYKDSIRAMIPERDVLDNIIVAVLVFIKERTLGNEQKCTLADVEEFLEDIAPVLPEECNIDTRLLAQFVVVDVLQKGGFLTNYRTYLSDSSSFGLMPIRLIEEEHGTYHLSDEAFDFLFRSKEIESELDYSVTRFRMAEYMKRNNYSEALDQSRELVTKIRSMKVSIDDFLRRCRENIAKISIDQYESVVGKTRNLLESEYEELKIIQDTARERAEGLSRAMSNGVDIDQIQKNRKALNEIIYNIQMTIDEQRGLINKRMSLSDTYQSILSDSYTMNRYERMNFDRDLLAVLRSEQIPMDLVSTYLLFPLTKPEMEKRFSLENFYAIQARISEIEDEEIEDLTEEENEKVDPVLVRNERYLNISRSLFRCMQTRTQFKISEFVASLSDEELYEFCEENSLPQVILALYSLQVISVAEWKHSDEMIVEPMGEFELSWCLSMLPAEYLEMESFSIRKLGREFAFTVTEKERQNHICMSDFMIEVRK